VAGATGTTGLTGDQGLQGLKGDAGAAGSTGAKGDNGDQGIQGVKGDTGATGPAGAAGSGGTSYQRTIIVSPVDDGNATFANATELQGALIDAGLQAQDGKGPVLVYVEAGNYRLQQTLSIPAYVYLTGAGAGVGNGSMPATQIRVDSFVSAPVITVLGAGSASTVIANVFLYNASQNPVITGADGNLVLDHIGMEGSANQACITGQSVFYVSDSTIQCYNAALSDGYARIKFSQISVQGSTNGLCVGTYIDKTSGQSYAAVNSNCQ
jgi:hypothetical protein